jgi:transposase InsO family protein
MGPFPEDENGNKFIIVVIDVFSRFVELYAVPELTAENSAKVLIEYTSRYATPDRILTDNGKEYVNKIMKELINLLYTRHLTILPYSHEENSIVERENKEVLRHLRAIVGIYVTYMILYHFTLTLYDSLSYYLTYTHMLYVYTHDTYILYGSLVTSKPYLITHCVTDKQAHAAYQILLQRTI